MSQFESSFSKTASSCHNAEIGARAFGIGLGIILGGLVGIAILGCACVGGYAAYKHCERRNPSNRFIV